MSSDTTTPTRRCSHTTVTLGAAGGSSWRWACSACGITEVTPTPAGAIRLMTAHVEWMTRQQDGTR